MGCWSNKIQADLPDCDTGTMEPQASSCSSQDLGRFQSWKSLTVNLDLSRSTLLSRAHPRTVGTGPAAPEQDLGDTEGLRAP